MTLTLVRDVDLDLPTAAPRAARALATPRRSTEEHRSLDVVEEWGRASFPASDPPANW